MSIDVEMKTIATLNLKRGIYFVRPFAISLYRTRYKKYKLSPKSTMRKKVFSTRSQMRLRVMKVGLVPMCAGIHIQ